VHTPNVVCAAARDLVVGGPGGLPADQFAPTQTTTRGQLATLVANMLVAAGLDAPVTTPEQFTDDDSSVHEASIDRLAAYGILGDNGEQGDRFFPDRPAARDEMASFMHRTYTVLVGTALPAGDDVFADDDGNSAEDAIEALAAAGIVSGKSAGLFDPDATVTREQVATFFVQLLDAVDAVGAL
jgi:hypothetical protein